MAITITFATAGSFTIEDDGTPGNATSIVRRDSDGAILAVIPHPADSLTIRATVPGVNLTFNVTDSFGSGTLTVGSLTNAAETPDSIVVENIRSSSSVTLVSNGSITEGGSDFAADITASSIILSAVSGVGTPGNAIETQTGLMEAETTTGGINIGNFGDLQVGGFSADVDGLDVVTSGDIILTNLGTITLSDETAFDSVHGGDTSGNVTLIANGFDSDITSNVDQSSIIAPRGSIFLTAGRDVSFGLAGADFGNDVRANNDIIVNAGRDFLLSGFADFFANGVLGNTGGGIIVNAGRNVSLLDDTGNSASLATLGSNGGPIVVSTGANGTFTAEAPSTNAISSSAGDVIINADRILIAGTSGITAPGTVTLRPVTAGREIVLGSLTDSGVALELSDAELDRVFADVLIVGSNSAGPVTVSSALSFSLTNTPELIIRSGTDIIVNANITGLFALSLRALDNVFQTATSSINAGSFTIFVDEVDDDPGVGGIATLNGSSAVATTLISGNVDADTLNGNSAANTLLGLAGNDTLRGFGGADTLDGGAGADTLTGGDGNDFYLVDNLLDIVIEAPGEGTDAVQSSVSFTLGDNVENLTLTGTADIDGTGNGLANTIIGNSGDNVLNGRKGDDTLSGLGGDDTLNGNSGNDILDGGEGADAMNGLLDNDTYIVDNVGDVVTEGAAAGTDTVLSSVTFTLGANVENLTLTGLAAIDGTGNDDANILIGNTGNNVLNGRKGEDTLSGLGGDDTLNGNAGSDILDGGDGDDTLNGLLDNDTLNGNAGSDILDGGDGNDLLDGGPGADAMIGGLGDDTFIVDNVGDVATEGAAAGTDTVLSSVTFTLGANVENLTLTGAAAIDGTGNADANVLTGNNAANVLTGRGGDDTLSGRKGDDALDGLRGDDTLDGNAGDDILNGGDGADTLNGLLDNDTLNGNAGGDILDGGDGADTLNGGGDADTLEGGNGADKFVFDAPLGSTNIDTILDFASGIDGILLENSVFTGLAEGSLSPDAFTVGSAATTADHRIVYDPTTGALLFDADGSGAGAAIQFATLDNQPASLSASDFSVI